MGKVLYNYNVLDTTTMEYVFKNQPLSVLCEKIGIPKDKVTQYTETGYLYDRRYHITRVLVDSNEEVSQDDIVTPMPQEWQDEWNYWRKIVGRAVKR